jgi:hypothetical protein
MSSFLIKTSLFLKGKKKIPKGVSSFIIIIPSACFSLSLCKTLTHMFLYQLAISDVSSFTESQQASEAYHPHTLDIAKPASITP